MRTCARPGWTYGSALQPPVLYPSREAAAGALAASPLAASGLSIAHVTEVWHPGMTGPRPYAYQITPGTCENPETGTCQDESNAEGA
jgi:hypothetical protein